MNKMKKTKLKLLFLALLGLILIPTTNAYELGVNLNWTDANYDVGYKDAKFTLYNSSYPYIVANPCSNPSQGSKCFSAPYYSSSIFNHSYRIHVSLSSWSFEKFFGVAYKDLWEWRDFYYSSYSEDNKVVQKIFNTPSRTAFSVKMTNGKEYLMDTVYFYHNTLVFMDSRNWFTLYLNGNIKASDGVVFVDPFLKEDNFFFIRFSEKKAWSMTVSEEEAWNWFFWKKNWELLKTLKFTKSYEVREWWETIFPINFHVYKDKQGWPWYVYQEDIEFVSPEWNAGNPNNQQTGQNQALIEYNFCFKYYNSIKIYTSYDYNCYKSLLDSAPLTGSYNMPQLLKPWQDIKDWNGEGNIAIQTQDLTCHSLIKLKREYKQQYQEKRAEFLKISSENFFYPHTMDIKAYCGDRPKDDENFSPSFLGSIWDFISGMFEKKGTWTGFNYSEKMEYYREKTLCTLFGWLDDKYCEVLNDVNTKNRYIKKDIDKGVDNSWWFSSFFSSIKLEFERGKKFFSKWVCFNPWITLEWDILVYLPMIALSLFFIWLLRNVK